MVLQRLLGSKATRSLTVVSIALEAKRSLERGNTVRAIALLGVTVLAWKWAMIGMVAQGLLKVLRRS